MNNVPFLSQKLGQSVKIKGARFIFRFCLIFMCIALCFTFGGCHKYYNESKVISEYRSCLFYFKSEDFVATFTSGKREKDFSYNGVHTSLVPYGVLVVDYNSIVGVEDDRRFVLLIDSLQFTGKLEYNPVDSTFVADIGKEITEDSDIYLRLWGGGVSDQSHMTCVSKGFIDYKDAFYIALDAFDDKLKEYKVRGKVRGEFFLKFVGDKAMDEVSYYVQFIGEDKRTFVALVDVYTGKIKYTKGL